MDRINELLAKLTECSPEELTELGELIDARFDELQSSDEASADSVAEMNALIEGATNTRNEVQRRADELAEATAAKADLKAKMDALRAGETEEPEPEKVEEPEPDPAKAEEEPEKVETEDAPVPPIGDKVPVAAEARRAELQAELDALGAEPITASGDAGALPRGAVPGGHIAKMAAGARAQGSPERAGAGNDSPYTVTIVAAAGVPNVNPGEPLTSSEALAEAMSEKLMRIQTSRDHSAALIASARWEYPEERRLDDNMRENTRKIDAVCGIKAPRVSKSNGALVATGGVCLPTNVDYSVPTWSSADRPIRDGLPAFQATRGGIQFVTPPDIGTAGLQGTAAGAGLATGIWTEATDAAPGGVTKPVWQVACGAPVQVYVDAIPTRVEMGNMMSRFAPEQIAANTEQAIATAAREADLNLLTKMYQASNQVLASQFLGATRDILATVDLVAPQYRYSHRYPKGIGLTAMFPEWAADLIRADMARELAHDNAGSQNALAITDAQIEDWFSARGIDVIWTMDGLAAGTYGTGGHAIPAQFWPKITAGAKPQWPGQTTDGSFVVSWLLFITGTYQFLDGGRLDLGVVRDSTLDATNDYETFVETFESVAFRGNEVYQMQNTVLPNGVSSAAAVGTYHE